MLRRLIWLGLLGALASAPSSALAAKSPLTDPARITRLAADAYVWGLAPEFVFRFEKYNDLVTAPRNTLGGGGTAARGRLRAGALFNGFDALPDGTLIAKSVYRAQGCTKQGPDALFQCPNAGIHSILVSIDPRTLQVLDQVTLSQPVGGRPTTTRFRGNDYVYLATSTTAIRYLIQNGKFTLDGSWNPGNIYLVVRSVSEGARPSVSEGSTAEKECDVKRAFVPPMLPGSPAHPPPTCSSPRWF